MAITYAEAAINYWGQGVYDWNGNLVSLDRIPAFRSATYIRAYQSDLTADATDSEL
jgi:hypothetical protein